MASSADNATAGARVKEQIECLALTIYFEARGEPRSGQVAVGHVVMNRVADSRFPDDVCEVVRQGGEEVLHRCQFSWWCDGRSDTPRHAASWRKIEALARRIFWHFSQDPTNGALWYHANYVAPQWRETFERGPQIGRHIFYIDPSAKALDTPQIARAP